VVNVKCEGCKRGIIISLENAGLKNVDIDLSSQVVSFEGDEKIAKELLNKMGYPEISSPEEKKFSKKVKSFVSCAKGKFK